MVSSLQPPKTAGFSLPRSISSIAITVGGLALFLILGSCLLISTPIASTLHLYLLGTTAPPFTASKFPNTTSDSDSAPYNTDLESKQVPGSNFQAPNDKGITNKTNAQDNIVASTNSDTSQPHQKILDSNSKAPNDNRTTNETKAQDHIVVSANSDTSQQHQSSTTLDSEAIEMSQSSFPAVQDNVTSTGNSREQKVVSANSETSTASSQLHGSSTKADPDSCDLYHGKWFYDSSGPLYTNNTCPVLTQMQNCQGNGRPDKDYENWRWKPSQCDLPRFDPKKFLELMRGKTLAFIGDSVARNQMESMLCILWQVEVPINRGSRRMQRWLFRASSVNIIRVWSSWLVHQTSDPFDFAPAGVVKLHLDMPDDSFMDLIPSFDVVVLSSGHWFAKQSVYIYNNEIVGGQLWWPDNKRPQKIDSTEAFKISVETIVGAMGNLPNYNGLTIVRSYSPDHYEGGAWNTGGSCTGKSRPALEGELVENGFTNIMHQKQVMGFNKAMNKTLNKSKFKFMDITEAFQYRHDGHPGPYRSPDANKITKRGPHGEPPPQDCLHWCMPGPVDTWNEIIFEIIRREF